MRAEKGKSLEIVKLKLVWELSDISHAAGKQLDEEELSRQK